LTPSRAVCAELGRTTLIIDIDPQGNATSGLGLEKEEDGSIYSCLLGEDEAVDKLMETSFENLYIIPGELALAGAEIEVARSDDYQGALKGAIQDIVEAEHFDYIFIDCPPSIGVLTMNALTASHSVLAPFQCEYYALEGIATVKYVLETIRESGTNPTLDFEGIVLTMFDGRTNLSKQVAEEVRGYFHDLVYQTVVPRNVRLSEAPSHGLPINRYAPDSAGAKAYRLLAEEFIARVDSKNPNTPTPPAPLEPQNG